MRRIGIIRRTVHIGGDDIRIDFLVMLCEPIGCGFCRCCFQVIQVTVLFLIVRQTFTHVIQHIPGKPLHPYVSQVSTQPLGIQANFIHTDQADGGEVILKCAQIPLGVRIQAHVQKPCNDCTLGLQAAGSNIHQIIQALVEFLRCFRQIGQTRHVQGDHTDRARGLTGPEEATGLLPQFPQVKTQAAAHRTHVTGFHVGIDIVGEIRSAILGGHFKQKLVVLCLRPVKIPGNGVCRDRVLESATIGIAFDHDLNECLVDHIHFTLAVAIGEIHFPSADQRRKILHVVRHNPVQGHIGEGCLCAPAAWCVHTIDERLDCLLDLTLCQVIHFHKRSKVCIKR